MRRPLLLALVLASVPCQAGVVSRDLFEPGDGLLTYDAVNGQEWLDFSASRRLFDSSSNSAIELPVGFRLATLDEIDALMQSAGVTAVRAWTIPGGPPAIHDLIELMGETGRFSGSLIGEMPFAGGLLANDATDSGQPDNIIAVLAFNLGLETSPITLNRPALAQNSSGYYRLTAADYPYALGVIDQNLLLESTPDAFAPPFGSVRLAEEITSEPRFIEVLSPDGEIVAVVRDFDDLHNVNIFSDAAQLGSALWLVRDAIAVPEPSTACLALMACAASLRLRAFA